ncbi:MAG TPA: sodium-translocating pyrophosphatase [Firmicutes bacterium]|jgi:K(+)-stimulated pyrophosphate-energized sodium pump|nr:sodium-translocating pyrophosphatase [Bacillota bacterium]
MTSIGASSILYATLAGGIGLLFVIYLVQYVMKKDPGDDRIQELSGAIYEGAMAFLRREYKVVLVFIAVLFVVLLFAINTHTAIAFLVGAITSVSAGYVGMKIATAANGRTTQAATGGFNEALRVAFPGGAVMGMYVVSIGLFSLSLVYYIMANLPGGDVFSAVELISGFSMGASLVALFARVAGGIYTKAADVGADLVGKVEKGIPEDDPRNPAVIADLVGDNVGDVAGMGADLYESYVGAIVSALVIATATGLSGPDSFKKIMFAFGLAGMGIIVSIIGTFFVRTGETEGDPGGALRTGTFVSAGLAIIGAFLLSKYYYGELSVFWAALFGLLSGMVIGQIAEKYTSGKAVEDLAETCRTGAATNIIGGFALSMRSTVVPLIFIALSTLISFYTAGFYGIAIAALGMLSTAGMTVSVDAYGPISDNAGGIAEMAQMPPQVREVTDSLDAAGNTTAAIAKGFAIGSAALTALALFFAYVHAVQLDVIDLLSAKVVAGIFIGAMVPYIFASAVMSAVGRAAFKVVEEVRRQFAEIPGLMEGTGKADYAQCVDITTAAALREMVGPGLVAVLIPLLIGIFLGPETLGGVLAGALATGVPLAIQLANAGGAWDNAKKYIEAGNLGGKGTPIHAAAVIGDTVGDPFKDTAAPAMNILIKLMTVVALVFAPLILHLNGIVGFF